MARATTYDVTRLITRILNRTPNGIDRLDIAYARHFLSAARNEISGIVHFGPLGHRVISSERANALVAGILRNFREQDDQEPKETLEAVIDWIEGRTPEKPRPVPAPRNKRMSYWRVPRYYLHHSPTFGTNPVLALPRNAAYVCVSQYPLSEPGAYNWLIRRPDIKPVFFLHDMLPLHYPEYFKPQERERHRHRLENLSRHAAGLLVSTRDVKAQAATAMAQLGRVDMPIHIAPVPMADAFKQEKEFLYLTDKPYFICCGTLEPRKNHLLLLNIWRELALRLGDKTPKLVLVGARGWENENIVDMLERSKAVQNHVVELNTLTTQGLSQLMRGARAVLMPSFGEGFGLPVAEARALNVPVIASDIAVFREFSGLHIQLISPLNGEAWMDAILTAMTTPREQTRSAARLSSHVEESLDSVTAFVDSL